MLWMTMVTHTNFVWKVVLVQDCHVMGVNLDDRLRCKNLWNCILAVYSLLVARILHNSICTAHTLWNMAPCLLPGSCVTMVQQNCFVHFCVCKLWRCALFPTILTHLTRSRGFKSKEWKTSTDIQKGNSDQPSSLSTLPLCTFIKRCSWLNGQSSTFDGWNLKLLITTEWYCEFNLCQAHPCPGGWRESIWQDESAISVGYCNCVWLITGMDVWKTPGSNSFLYVCWACFQQRIS